MSNVETSLPKSVTVEGFIVYKLKLSEYAQVFEKLQNLPALIGGLDLESKQSMIASLPKIIATAMPEVMQILSVATRTDPVFIDEKMDAKQAIKCLKAMFEINDFLGVWEEMNNMLSSKQATRNVKKT